MLPHKVLVTGASGFIGAHLVARLLSDGRQVFVLARPSSNLPADWKGRVEVITSKDLSEAGLRDLLPARLDSVYHLAAYGVRPDHRDLEEISAINVVLPAALARLCADRGARMVMAGTFSEYQNPVTRDRLTEDSPLESRKLYGASKAAGGLLANAIAASCGTPFRLLRLFKVYGAGEAPHRLLPALVTGLARRERVAMSPGTQILDFVYVSDIVEAMLRADQHAEKQGGVATWNVATGRQHSVREFAECVAKAMKVDLSLLDFGAIGMRKDDEPWLVGSPDRLEVELGWKPSIGLEEGVGAAVDDLLHAASHDAKGNGLQ